MDPQHLKADELDYELTIRGIQLSDASALERLMQEISDEGAGKALAPSDINRITRNIVTQEIKEYELKLRDIHGDATESIKIVDDELTSIAQSRIHHLVGRVSRLKAAVPTHTGVDRLMGRVKDLESQMNVARDSLGSGEHGAVTIEDDHQQDSNELLNDDAIGQVT